ncbi:MAG: portal protein, partial [Gemmatimonadota bacterium]
MDKSLGEKINVYYQTLRDEKAPRAERMKEVAELLAPHRALNTDINDTPEDEHLGEEIYDGNPLDAVRKMVDGLFGNSVGPTSKWMETVPNVDKYQYPQLDEWLRDSDKMMITILERSRFYK